MIFKELSPGWNRFALCLIFSFLMSLAYPPLQVGFLAYWALVPLFFLLEDISSKQALVWGYITGFFWNAGTLYWISKVTIPGLIGVLLVMPIYLAIYAWLHVIFRDHFKSNFIFIMPAAWVSLEYLKSLGSLGFPWTSLAYTQTYYTDLIQYASITGVYGVSFWVVLINVILFILIKKRMEAKKYVGYIFILILLFIIPFLYGKFVLKSAHKLKETIKVAVLQGNIDPFLKYEDRYIDHNFVIYDSLTFIAGQQNPDLIVWPETATATFLRLSSDRLNRMINIIDSLNVSILTGSPDFQYFEDRSYETYNGILFFQSGNPEIQSYWKMHLVPFGERVPFEDALPFFHNFLESLNMGTGDFSPGKEVKIFNMRYKDEILPIAGVICYESVFPDLVRNFIKMGGKLLVIVTNDAWFGNSSGPYQHAQIAVFRAIENRVSIARSANTGISSFIDPFGRVLSQTGFNKQTLLVQNIPLRITLTFYTKYGDIFSYTLITITGICLLMVFMSKGRRKMSKVKSKP